MAITAQQIKDLARECGFELAGVAPAEPTTDFSRFERWRSEGFAAGMSYLTDRRGDLRADPKNLLPEARSIVCVGKLYNTARPAQDGSPLSADISRYAVGEDYHTVMRSALRRLQSRIVELNGAPVASRICVDTAPLLERSLARQAGLGWIGKNTCLINQASGSWFFLGELLLALPLAPDAPPADRCGTCRRCIDACPTDAIVPTPEGGSFLDSRLCISYLTIEHRGDHSPSMAQATGNHIFGCDICQEVCPWNRRAPITDDPSLQPRLPLTDLSALAAYSADDFARQFRSSPLWRARHSGFLRNVAAALGNSGQPEALAPLGRLAQSPDAVVSAAARQALNWLSSQHLTAPSSNARAEGQLDDGKVA